MEREDQGVPTHSKGIRCVLDCVCCMGVEYTHTYVQCTYCISVLICWCGGNYGYIYAGVGAIMGINTYVYLHVYYEVQCTGLEPLSSITVQALQICIYFWTVNI